ncbi:hypothetical protein B566_EDAN015096 [Ephemera danica]|nr:hypothetical protein B566_EDAN015096 [Ephemera danica]
MPEDPAAVAAAAAQNGPASGTTSSPSPARAKRGSVIKTVLARVRMLDGTDLDLHVDRKCKGYELLVKVCEQINLLEKDYFGLTYVDRHDPRTWLEMDKSVSKFIKNEPWMFNFEVKFYPPDPAQLQEDITRLQKK